MNMKEKMIRFIDSHYNELFSIPDGGKIIITRPDMGETFIRDCKYLDETHTDIGNNCYHICQFAERMENIGATYEPESPYILQVSKPTEKALSYSPDGHNPKLIGHLRGDFGDGQNFYHSWFDYQPALNTSEFKADFQKAVETFRKTILKDIYTMSRHCYKYPNAQIEGSNDARCFKANSEQYQYFLRATPRKGEYNFYIYCYAKEPERTLSNLLYARKDIPSSYSEKAEIPKMQNIISGKKSKHKKRQEPER